MIGFDYPWVAALLPLPLLAWWLLPLAPPTSGAMRVPFFERVAAIATSRAVTRPRQRGRLLMMLLGWLLLLAAASGPRWIGEPLQLPVSGRDLMLAVDISGSMQIEDMHLQDTRVPRLIAVKAVVDRFIEQREGDRLGLILFGTQAYLQAPLTFDRATVRQLLQEAQIGFAGEETAIGDAIGLAIKRLRDRPGQRHILVLLTDGANTAGEVAPLEAAAIAAREGLVIYTIGIGAEQMITRGLFGTSLGARRMNPSAHLDEAALQRIAELTGGRYFRARNPQELLEIYALLDELEPVEADARTYRPQRALYVWPLGGALALSLLVALAQLSTRRLPPRGPA